MAVSLRSDNMQHVIACINHDIVVSLCSELLMRLTYYMHLAYGDNKANVFQLFQESNPGPFYPESTALPLKCNLTMSQIVEFKT